MTRVSSDTYEYEPASFSPVETGDLETVQDVAQSIIARLPIGMFGYEEITIDADKDTGDICNQELPEDQELAFAVLESLPDVVTGTDIKTIQLIGIRNPHRYAAHLEAALSEGHPRGNLYTQYGIKQIATKKHIVRPKIGQLSLCLAGEASFELSQGIISCNRSRVVELPPFDYYLNDTRAIPAEMKSLKSALIVAEDGYFLRGPAVGKVRTTEKPKKVASGEWNYLEPGSVRRQIREVRMGQIDLLLDFADAFDLSKLGY